MKDMRLVFLKNCKSKKKERKDKKIKTRGFLELE